MLKTPSSILGILLCFHTAQCGLPGYRGEAAEADTRSPGWATGTDSVIQDESNVEPKEFHGAPGGLATVQGIEMLDEEELKDARDFHLQTRGGKSSKSKSKSRSKSRSDDSCGDCMGVMRLLSDEEWVNLGDNQWVRVKRITEDGDCLFSAFRHQLSTVLGYRGDELPSIAQLRSRCAQYLKEVKDDTIVAANILESATSDPNIRGSVRRSGRTEEQYNSLLIDRFIRQLSHDNVWGGTESIYALTQLYGVSIRIYSAGQGDFRFGESGNELRLCYRNRGSNHKHYDSVIQYHYGTSPPSAGEEASHEE